jgi:hypothetical protein
MLSVPAARDGRVQGHSPSRNSTNFIPTTNLMHMVSAARPRLLVGSSTTAYAHDARIFTTSAFSVLPRDQHTSFLVQPSTMHTSAAHRPNLRENEPLCVSVVRPPFLINAAFRMDTNALEHLTCKILHALQAARQLAVLRMSGHKKRPITSRSFAGRPHMYAVIFATKVRPVVIHQNWTTSQ